MSSSGDEDRGAPPSREDSRLVARPDLHLTGYRKLKVVLSMHDAGGLSLKDSRLAAEIDALAPNP